MGKDLKSFCYSLSIHSRIKNALWEANGYGLCYAPEGWEPELDDFLNLDARTIARIGPKSLEVLRAWVAAND